MSDSSPVRFRHIRITESIRDEWGRTNGKLDHVLTLATRLDGDKMFIGYALNRVEKVARFGEKQDRFSPDYGRTRATGRLNSATPLVIPIIRDQPIIDSIIQGLLALPTEGSGAHYKAHYDACLKSPCLLHQIPAVPSALKNILRKSLKEYQTKTRIEG